MTKAHGPEQNTLMDGFTLKEKVVLRCLLYGMMGVGTIGILLQSIVWGVIYAALAIFAMIGVVLPVLCVRCPYPFLQADCLFMPHHWIVRVLKYKPLPMRSFESKLLVIVLFGLVALPQFWLIHQWAWLSLFWLCALPLLVVFPGYYCRRCRHARCPFNCVKGARSFTPSNNVKS